MNIYQRQEGKKIITCEYGDKKQINKTYLQ